MNGAASAARRCCVGLQVESQHPCQIDQGHARRLDRLRGLARSPRAVDGPRQVEQRGQRFRGVEIVVHGLVKSAPHVLGQRR